MAVPWRRGEKSRRMISGTAMLPTVMARPRMTVPAITMAPPPAERTATPARTPASVSVMASSAPNLRPASEARGAASEKHSTGIPVSRPSSTGENPSSCCIGPSTGATATKGPRMLRAMRPMHASRIQLRGTFVPMLSLIGRGGRGAGSGKGFSSLPLLSCGAPRGGKAAGPQVSVRAGPAAASVRSRSIRSLGGVQEPVPWGVADARCLAEPARLRHPAHAVGDHLLDLRLVVHRVLLVARAEVEDAALAPRERHARAEHLTALEGADEDEVVGFRNVEQLAVHLLLRDP